MRELTPRENAALAVELDGLMTCSLCGKTSATNPCGACLSGNTGSAFARDERAITALRREGERAGREDHKGLVRIDDAIRLAQQQPPDLGIPLPSPEYAICRLVPGRATFLGGYVGDGKTSLMLQTVLANAAHTLLFTYEMNARDMGARAARILHGSRWRDFDDASQVPNVEIYLSTEMKDLEPVIDAEEYDLVVIDHLHLLGYNDRREIEKRAQQIMEWSLEKNLPFLVLAQLTNDREHHKPRQGAFRESGMISANADLELYVWVERDSDGNKTDRVEIINAKDRHEGNEGTTPMTWDAEFCALRRRDAARPIPDEDAPGGEMETLRQLGFYD